MSKEHFFDWKDCTSKSKFQKSTPRAYLQDMVFICFTRGNFTLKYKTAFAGNPIELNCLLAKHSKTGILKPNCRTYNRGVAIDRKESLLLKLRPIIPENRIQFWENLPTYNCTDDLNRETDLADDMS